LLSPSEKQKTQPSYSPANFVIVQSTVAKPKTKSYTVKKVDRKVILTTPQHGKNRSVSNNKQKIKPTFSSRDMVMIAKGVQNIFMNQ